MKIAIHVLRYVGRYPNWKKVMIDCKGTGTEDDPVIIEPSVNLPQAFLGSIIPSNSSEFKIVDLLN